MQIAENLEEFGEGVFLVGLEERHLTFVVGVVAEKVGDLLEHQDHADGRQQASDDARGHE